MTSSWNEELFLSDCICVEIKIQIGKVAEYTKTGVSTIAFVKLKIAL